MNGGPGNSRQCRYCNEPIVIPAVLDRGDVVAALLAGFCGIGCQLASAFDAVMSGSAWWLRDRGAAPSADDQVEIECPSCQAPGKRARGVPAWVCPVCFGVFTMSESEGLS